MQTARIEHGRTKSAELKRQSRNTRPKKMQAAWNEKAISSTTMHFSIAILDYNINQATEGE